MVGLHYLKHVHHLSDEETVERWVENPYWQFFCGFEFSQTEMPIDASTMTRWRKRIGPEGLSEMLKVSVDGRLDRNFLLGHDGDAINALLVAAGHNLRLILKAIAIWRAYILAAIKTINSKTAQNDTWRTPADYANSMT